MDVGPALLKAFRTLKQQTIRPFAFDGTALEECQASLGVFEHTSYLLRLALLCDAVNVQQGKSLLQDIALAAKKLEKDPFPLYNRAVACIKLHADQACAPSIRIPKQTCEAAPRGKLPRVGLGTWRLTNAEDAILSAIACGCRHVDTAPSYGTEAAVGNALRRSSVARSEIYVGTKLSDDKWEEPSEALLASLQTMGLDYVDVYWIHHPESIKGTLGAVWAKMQNLKKQGLTKYVGVCNFDVRDLKKLEPPPSFVQCKHSIYHRGGYVDPYGSFADMIEHCKQNNIQVIGVSPFNPLYATGMNPPNDPILNAVGVTPNEQLAWCAQLLGGVLMRTADETKHSEVFGAKMPGCPCPPAHLALMSNLHWFVNLEGLSGPYDGSIWPTSQEDMREHAALIPALFQSGDFVKMMGMVQQYLDSNKLDGPSFLQVISGMIDCAENNGHVVKEKVLRRLQADVERIQQERIEMRKNVRREATAKNALETSWGAANEVAKCIGVKDCQGYVENCRPTIPAIAEEMGRRLKTCGYVIGDNFLSNKSVKKLVAEMRPLEHTYDPAEVWVGEGDSGAHIVAPTVRGDQILWVCGGHETAPEDELFDSAGVQPNEKLAPCKPDVRRKTAMFCALAAVVRQMDQFVLDFLAPTCCPGLIERSDAMLAVYPPNGARFQKHIDNTMRDGRKLTVMTYFNEQWDAEKGGNLIVYHPEEGAIRVEPIAGRIVMFWSDKSKHAVEPNYGNTRRSMCIWYFDQDERREAVKRREVVGLDASSEATARNFVNDLLVLNEAFSSVKAKLCKDVKKLPKPALAYVEKVLCVDDLVSWVHGLEEVQLSYQRSLLHRMGV